MNNTPPNSPPKLRDAHKVSPALTAPRRPIYVRSNSTSSLQNVKSRGNQAFEKIRSRPATPRHNSDSSEPDFGCRDRDRPEVGLHRYDPAWRILHDWPPLSPPGSPANERKPLVFASPLASPRSSISSMHRSDSSGTSSWGSGVSPAVQATASPPQVPRAALGLLPAAAIAAPEEPQTAAQIEGLARKQDFVVRRLNLSDEQRLRLYAALGAEQLDAFCQHFGLEPKDAPLGPLHALYQEWLQHRSMGPSDPNKRRALQAQMGRIWRQPDGDTKVLRFLRFAVAQDAALPRPPREWLPLSWLQLQGLALQLDLSVEQAQVLRELRAFEAH